MSWRNSASRLVVSTISIVATELEYRNRDCACGSDIEGRMFIRYLKMGFIDPDGSRVKDDGE
jgi:hypothetical protein